MGAALLWRRQVNGPDFWLFVNFVAVIWVGAGGFGMRQQPCYMGLFQKVMYLGFYFWMWIVVREIERMASQRPCRMALPENSDGTTPG
jgi:hypothetical protein